MNKAYPSPRQDPQGNWYLAFENAQGTHYYSEHSPTFPTRKAAAIAAKNMPYCVDCGESEDDCVCD